MKITLHIGAVRLTDLPEGKRRITRHPFADHLGPRFVSITLNDAGMSLHIDSAADADELIEWATAAKHYLTQETP